MRRHTVRHKKQNRAGAGRIHRNNRLVSVLLFCAVIAAACFTWGTAAKYTKQQEAEAVVKADALYFSSDYLTEKGAVYTLNPGEDTFAFELRNYDGLLVSELEITYTVKVDGNEHATGTLAADVEDKKTVTIDKLEPGKTYTIVAEGKNGYLQTLSATVTTAPEDAYVHKNTKDHGEYVVLTVWSENTAGEATITVPDSLIPDATDEDLQNLSGDTVTLNLDKYESRTYRFFKSAAYNNEEITVEYGGETLDETALN